MLQVGANFSAIGAVTVAYCKEVAMSKSHNMWISNVSILIDFIRIMWWDPAFGSERKLSDDVSNLVYRWISFWVHNSAFLCWVLTYLLFNLLLVFF